LFLSFSVSSSSGLLTTYLLIITTTTTHPPRLRIRSHRVGFCSGFVLHFSTAQNIWLGLRGFVLVLVWRLKVLGVTEPSSATSLLFYCWAAFVYNFLTLLFLLFVHLLAGRGHFDTRLVGFISRFVGGFQKSVFSLYFPRGPVNHWLASLIIIIIFHWIPKPTKQGGSR
jgi:hypothetical protein